MHSTVLHVEAALLGPKYQSSGPMTLHIEDGRIARILPFTGTPPRLLALPAFTDAHNHARPLSTTSFGTGGKPLESWLPQLATLPSVDPYDAAAASFARSVRGGCTSVMVHLTRVMGGLPFADEAREIARAARDVGVSIGLAVAMRDRNPLVYGGNDTLLRSLSAEDRALVTDIWMAPMPSIPDQMVRVAEVAAALSDQAHVDVQFGPTGVQWCSDALLTEIAGATARSGRRIHMHLLETKPQRDWADATYPQGITRTLDEIGLLSPRLTLAHCVWANVEDLERIARNGARIAVNVSSNLQLSSGIAPVPAMLDAGVDVAMGLDGSALDEDDDALREIRLFRLLNAGWGFARSRLTPEAALKAVCATGRLGIGIEPGGSLTEGMPADILLLDLARLDRDRIMPVDPKDYVFSRATKEDIVQLYSRGRLVLDNGAVVGVDLAQLHRRLRVAFHAGLPDMADRIALWPRLEAAIGNHYQGCC